MKFLDVIAQAFRNIGRQKLRSALTIFAVTIGALGSALGRFLSGWMSDHLGRLLTVRAVLIISTMLFPVIYLLVLGNSLNRQLSNIPLAVVDEAGNSLAAECRRLGLASHRDLIGSALPKRAGAPSVKGVEYRP